MKAPLWFRPVLLIYWLINDFLLQCKWLGVDRFRFAGRLLEVADFPNVVKVDEPFPTEHPSGQHRLHPAVSSPLPSRGRLEQVLSPGRVSLA